MENNKTHLFDNPKNVKRLLFILYACCIVLLLLEFVIHRHVIHSWENLWGFYPVYGFVGCVVLVLVATWMRTFLMRPENYYANGSKSNADESATIEDKSDTDLTHNNETGASHVDD